MLVAAALAGMVKLDPNLLLLIATGLPEMDAV